jgi:hypothetical protein
MKRLEDEEPIGRATKKARLADPPINRLRHERYGRICAILKQIVPVELATIITHLTFLVMVMTMEEELHFPVSVEETLLMRKTMVCRTETGECRLANLSSHNFATPFCLHCQLTDDGTKPGRFTILPSLATVRSMEPEAETTLGGSLPLYRLATRNVPEEETFRVNVTTLSGIIVPILVHPSDTVCDIKSLVAPSETMFMRQVKLMSRNGAIGCGAKVADLGLYDGCFLQVALSARQ